MSHPITDIVVLTYNNSNILDRFLNCLYKNTSDFNLIIVDNNSSDNSVNHIKSFQRKETNITLLEEKTNHGVAGGRNIGIKAGTSEYVLCIDSDQFVLTSCWLNELFMILNKGYDSVGVDAWEMRPSNYKASPYHPFKNCKNVHDGYTYVGGGGHLVPRKIFEELDFFDDNYSPAFWEDSDFGFKMSKKNYKTIWHYKQNIYHLGHQTLGKKINYSISDQFKKSRDYFIKKWYPYFPKKQNSLMLSKILPEIFKKEK
jgi:GT2 family glycosyltransferase